MKYHPRSLAATLLALFFAGISPLQASPGQSTDEKVFDLRPKDNGPRALGHIGPTGIMAHIEVGVKVTVQGTRKGGPSEGRFRPGEMIVAVNGRSLEGKNPDVVLGNAITTAEASDGRLLFEVEAKAGRRKVDVRIPVLGTYAKNWPVDCPKSAKIIGNAAEFYHRHLKEGKADLGIPGALPCLFLLSTGDDRHLPVIKEHYRKFIENPASIGDHTWNNGYNGIGLAAKMTPSVSPQLLELLIERGLDMMDDDELLGIVRGNREFQGFEVYLNGKLIETYTWWQEPAEIRKWPIAAKDAALLKKVTNTLAIYTMELYPNAMKPHWPDEVFGRLNAYIEGLRKEDLYQD